MSFSLERFLDSVERFLGSKGEPDQEDDADPPKYGLRDRRLDRQAARRDAGNGIPGSLKQPGPTPFVEKLISECVQLIAAEKTRWARQTARLRKQVAELTSDIQEAERNLEHGNGQRTEYKGLATGDLAIWRSNAVFRAERDALERTQRQLASQRRKLAAHNADIDSQYNQHLGLLNQIVGYSWGRIATYRTELIRAHPHGDRLSTVITWGPAELAQALVASGELEQQVIKISGSHIEITSGKNRKED